MGKSILKEKRYAFAIVIVKMLQVIQKDQKEYVLTKQILRSGTTIGALISEAEFGQSKADFIHKLTIFLKEANETNYLLNLLHDTDCIENESFVKLSASSTELTKMLIASINTSKLNRS
jgi:four helix bundle protein